MDSIAEYRRSTNNWYMPKDVFPVTIKRSVKKDIKGFFVNSSTFVESDGRIFEGLELFSRCIGHTYVAENEYTFAKFLSTVLGEEKVRELLQHNAIKVDNVSISCQSRGINYINLRQGNKTGKIMIFNGMGRDASSCEMVAEQIFSSLNKIMHLPNLEPAIKVGERMLREFCLPALFKTNEVGTMHLIKAVDAFDGGRVEAFDLGNYDKVYSTDINAAYLSELQSIPNLSPKFVNWIDSPQYREDAISGFINCRINLPKTKIGYIAFRMITSDYKERLFFPSDVETLQTITKTEYDMLRKYDVPVTIESASWAIPCASIDYPFQILSKKILEMGQYPILKQYKKGISSKLWGKMASTTSLVYNPFYASEVTSRLRCRITEISLRNQNSVLGVKVDSIQSLKPLDEKISKEIGDMKEDHEGEAILCNDFYTYYTKDNEDKNWFMGNQHICLKTSTIGIDDSIGEMYGVEDIGKVLEWEDDLGAPILSQYGSSKRVFDAKLTKRDLEKGKYTTKSPSSIKEMKDILLTWRGDPAELF